jgi:type I restriction enzyme S subunit
MNLLSYQKYKDSGVAWLGVIPAHWSVKRLKYISQITSSGVWGEDPPLDSTGYRVATTANIDMIGKIDVDGMTVRALSEEDLKQGLCLPGDIIVVKSSGSATNVITGKAGLVKEEHGPICFSNFTLRVRPSRKDTDNRFVWYFLNSDVVRAQIRLMVSTTTYPNLQVSEYGLFSLPVPHFEEQRAIADYLDRETAKIDALVAAKERLLEILAEKRRVLITRAVTRGLNPGAQLRDSGIPWLGPIPAHWELERARWLFHERDERSETGEEEMLTVSHLTGVTPRSEKNVNMFEAETTEGYKVCYTGDLVINTLWAWMGAMGVSPMHGIVSPAYHIYTPCERLDPAYVDLLVRIPVFAEEAIRFSKGVWSSRLRLYPEGLYEIWLPVPPRDEQRVIVAHIASETIKLDALRAAAERTISLSKERRAALIGAAVTGRIKVSSSQ